MKFENLKKKTHPNYIDIELFLIFRYRVQDENYGDAGRICPLSNKSAFLLSS